MSRSSRKPDAPAGSERAREPADEPTLLAARLPWLARRRRRLLTRWRRWRRPDTVRLNGVRIVVDRALFSPKIVARVYDGGYEAEECAALSQTLSSDDTVLELGAGMGYISAFAARLIGSARVTACEANPRLAALIARTHHENGVSPRLITGVMSRNGPQATRNFYIHREHFWSSSLTDLGTDYERVSVASLDWQAELSARRPSYLVMDIEGGEIELLQNFDAPWVSKLLVEFHPRKTGQDAVTRVFDELAARGFKRTRVAPGPHIYYFERAAAG